MNPDENERFVRHALDTYPCLRLVEASVGGHKLGDDGLRLESSMLESQQPPPPRSDSKRSEVLDDRERRCVVRFHPRAATDHNGTTTTTTTGAESQVADYREDAVGFFIAKFRKVRPLEEEKAEAEVLPWWRRRGGLGGMAVLAVGCAAALVVARHRWR